MLIQYLRETGIGTKHWFTYPPGCEDNYDSETDSYPDLEYGLGDLRPNHNHPNERESEEEES